MGTEIYFTNNPGDINELPGMYIDERDPPGFIAGKSMGTVAMADRSVRGTDGWHDITSPARFLEIFGERDYVKGAAAVNELWKALQGKPFGPMKMRRVRAADAVKASVTITNVIVTASSVGVWANSGNGLTLAVENATDGDVNRWNLRASYRGKEVVYQNLDTTVGKNNLAEVVGDDAGRFIDLTKSADGRPVNAPSVVLTLGNDGAVVDADYTTAVTEMAAIEGAQICLVPSKSVTQSLLNGTINTVAATVSDRVFLTWSGVAGLVAPSVDIAAQAAQITTRTDRVVWCYNSMKIQDSDTALLFDQGSHVMMASILAQNDVDIHAGAEVTKKQTAGVKAVANETLTRGDLIALKKAGISALEKVKGGFKFRDAVTTDLTPGKTELARRRMADFLQNSAADRLVFYVKARGTKSNRTQMVAELTDFTGALKEAERVVEDFEVINDGVNTQASRAQGQERILWRVDLLDHMLSVVLQTEIGTGVTIATN